MNVQVRLGQQALELAALQFGFAQAFGLFEALMPPYLERRL